MKKTIKVKLAGVVFNIDDDAYSMLKQYLDSLEAYFRAKSEGKEVIEDIESRIAEIFQSLTKETKEVINIADVTSMIETLGEANDIINEDDSMNEGTSSRGRSYSGSGKKLYRDPDNAVIGGVCGGLGAYFNVDPIWFRLLFLLLLLVYGTGLVYIILWIVLPKAETSAQKLEMQGENVTVKNIEKQVKEEFESVKDNLNNLKDSESVQKSKNAIYDFFAAIGSAFLVLFRVIAVIIGIIFILFGTIFLFSFLGALLFSNSLVLPDALNIPGFHIQEILPIFTNVANTSLLIIAIMLTVLIPLVLLVYWGIKIVFQLKVKDKIFLLSTLIIWLMSLIGLSSIAIFEGVNYNEQARIDNGYSMDIPANDTLYLCMNSKPLSFLQNDIVMLEVDNEGLYRDPNTGIIYGKPRLELENTNSSKTELTIEKNSQGRSKSIAREHASKIKYNWERKGDTLYFDHYFQLPETQRWRAQYVKLELEVPEGSIIYIEEEVENLVRQYIWTADGTATYNIGNQYWKVSKDGLIESD